MSYRHLYVHVPFCARRCSYCDFAIAVRARPPVRDYVEALSRELSVRALSPQQEPLDTLYLGGGTPSRLGGDGVAQLMGELARHFVVASDAEVTLEANPEDVTPGAVSAWRAAGVNRVSLGVQSFEPSVLSWMHRTHSAEDVYRAADLLRREGIPNWSLDLIYALPPEVPRDWIGDLEAALALAPPHISAYGLTVESGTPLAKWRARGVVGEVEEVRYEAEFLRGHETLTRAGYAHYEVSNYARPGATARHNSAYWRGVPYLALGPGAHGYDGERRRWNEREYVRWRERLGRGEDPLGGDEVLTAEARALEQIYLELRTTTGVEVRPGDDALLDRWSAAGWGSRIGGRFRLTPLGWLRLDALITVLTEHRSRL